MIKATVEPEADQAASEGQALATALVERLGRTRDLLANTAMLHWFEEWDFVSATLIEAVALTQSQSAEIARLRDALLSSGRHAGCLLADEVSNDFLMLVPGEVRAKLSTLTALCEAREAADAKNSELLEAAVEGQTYWQTRCQTLERALRYIHEVSEDDHVTRKASEALSTLSEEARDAN